MSFFIYSGEKIPTTASGRNKANVTSKSPIISNALNLVISHPWVADVKHSIAINDIIKINAVQVTNVASADMDGAELVLDADGDTSIRANTDDQIDFKLGNAIDITMGVNAMNILSGTTLTIDSGATITNSGTANGFGLSTGKAIVLAMLFGR